MTEDHPALGTQDGQGPDTASNPHNPPTTLAEQPQPQCASHPLGTPVWVLGPVLLPGIEGEDQMGSKPHERLTFTTQLLPSAHGFRVITELKL